jgi:NodT family efflux transporter outer membrane factor (OMF) lipoprotein
MTTRLRIAAIVSGLALAVGGCTTSVHQWWHNGFKVGPNYSPPAAPISPQWIDAANKELLTEPANVCDWWSAFNDPILNGLIETAYQQNLTLQGAGTRILEARAQRNIAAGNLFPQGQTALGTYLHAQLPNNLQVPLPSNVNLWATGFNLSWEIDFWGRFRRSVEAANASYGAAIEDYHDALVMMLSEVATSYVQLRTYEERLQYAQQNVAIQTGSTQIAEERFHGGVATELDMRQARSNLKQTESLIPPLVTGRRQASNALCILMGMPPDDLAARLAAAPIPKPPSTVAVGIPAELLRRRPDIRRAERQVAAECARIGVAEADLYPRLGVNGFLGVAADDISELFTPHSFAGFVAPMVQWKILNYGRLINNVRVHDARFQNALLDYQQTALVAQREVENAIVGFLESQQQAMSLDQGVAETARSVELVKEQFKEGVTDFNRVYNTESLLVQQQDQLAQTRGDIAANLIALYRALGGGWQYFCCDTCPSTQIMMAPATDAPLPAKPPENVPQPPVELPVPSPTVK